MLRVPVQSRLGNRVLMVIGALYTISAVLLLGWFFIQVGTGIAVADWMVQASLIGTALCGLWFVAIGMENLGRSIRDKWPHFTRRTSGAH